MNKILILIIAFFFLNNCSFNENSKIWNKKEKNKNFINQENVKKLFVKDEVISTELNPELKIDLNRLKTNNVVVNSNDIGLQNYNGQLKKDGSYNFSKLDDINHLDYKPAFLSEGVIFFDKKGTIIRYNDKQKIVWKNNVYSKSEKKLKPKLSFVIDNDNLLVADNIAKYYSLNINTGELNWKKNSKYPFNSEIKKTRNKFFAVDYSNTLRCYNINDGSECWKMQTEASFTISGSKFSLLILNDLVIFNNSIGDITAVDVESGLINWQLPTQSSSIINETYKFKISKLVSDKKSIFFSNNKNEFYSVDVSTGIVNWINKINSNMRPILSGNLIFTVSNNGYLFVIQKKNGNIIRINDLYKDYKKKKREKIIPIGFAIGKNNLYLTSDNGKMIIVNLELGKITNEIKISGKFLSEPIIYNKKLFLIKNGSIIRYN